MSKIQTKYHNELKSWPYKEASQIIKRQGGYSNFKIPEKKFILFPKFSNSSKLINNEKVLYEKKCLLGLNLL